MINIKWNIICTIIALMIFLFIENNWITVTNYIIEIKKLPREYEEFRIIHLSDIHNKIFGQNNLVNIIKKRNPNIIVITGDLIDRRRYNKAAAIGLLEKLLDMAPIYYVTGNHEWWSGKYGELKRSIEGLGVHILSDDKAEIKYGNKILNIIGIDDPAKYYEEYSKPHNGYKITNEKIDILLENINEEQVTILLSHRPELFELYKEKNIDLILCGHAHGGQIRLPFIGGIIAPNQGLFPKYDGGKYNYNEVNMIVNRGLGNSIAPIRVFNKPEVGVITLKKK
ncbi:MAG: metallophosphoesterase [Maledivibacter sp.]|jgi:predicted MPP superfamily phosphohydrolase|nr:metallophosphoesterase [Maledivibacter sp.]